MSEDPQISSSRYIIQIDSPKVKLTMPKVRTRFKGTGVKLDESYGPILVNPSLGRYVVRGTATPEARARAEKLPGVAFFADVQQKPMSKRPTF